MLVTWAPSLASTHRRAARGAGGDIRICSTSCAVGARRDRLDVPHVDVEDVHADGQGADGHGFSWLSRRVGRGRVACRTGGAVAALRAASTTASCCCSSRIAGVPTTRRVAVAACTATRAAARCRAPSSSGAADRHRAVVRHQRGRAAVERARARGRRARACRRSRTAPRAPVRRAAAAGSGCTAARSAPCDIAVLTGAWVCTTAGAPVVGVDAEVEVELGGRLEVAVDAVAVPVDHDDLLLGPSRRRPLLSR